MDKEQTVAEQQEQVVQVQSEQPVKEELIGEVISTKGERAIVELFKPNSKKKSNETLDVSNPISAKQGYIVKIAWRKISKTRDNLMLVLPPVLSLVAGFIFSYNLTDYFNKRKPVEMMDVMLVGVTAWFVLGLYYSIRYWRYTYGRGSQPTIIDIVRK